MSTIVAASQQGSISGHFAIQRVIRCKRMLSEMGYDPETGIFDALTDLAALKAKERRKTVRAKRPVQQDNTSISLVREWESTHGFPFIISDLCEFTEWVRKQQ